MPGGCGFWKSLEFIDELVVFPRRFDDQVDGASTAFHELAAHPVAQLSAKDVLSIGGREQDRRSVTPRKQSWC
jgi:hypothetical protein